MQHQRQYLPVTLRTCFLLKLFLLLAALTAAVVDEQRAAAALFIFRDTLNPAHTDGACEPW